MRNIKKLAIFMMVISMLMVQIFADNTSADFTKQIDDMIKVIQTNYYKDITVDELKNGAIKGMFEALDKHSNYFTPTEFASFMTEVNGEVVGIGVNVEKNANAGITVIAPIEGGAAYAAGIKKGDVIVSIDGVDITNYELDKAVALIRGTAGTSVKIGLKRAGSSETIYYTLVRKLVTINPVSSKILTGNIGFIKITQFNGHVMAKMNETLTVMDSKNVKGIIIDLRGNPGGYLSEVVDLCKKLIPAGPVVHIQQKGAITQTYSSDLAKAPYKIVVLVDGGSASASEIMAGAIKDSGTGILVGEKTYGKGTVQQIFPGENGAGYKITIANYLTPRKFSLDGIGLKPDVAVEYDILKKLASYSPMALTKTMKKGSLSLDVQGMQQRLKTLGYKIVNTNGIFDKATLSAVNTFQKNNKLAKDGVMNPSDTKVLKKLFDQKIADYDPQLDRAVIEMKKLLK